MRDDCSPAGSPAFLFYARSLLTFSPPPPPLPLPAPPAYHATCSHYRRLYITHPLVNPNNERFREVSRQGTVLTSSAGQSFVSPPPHPRTPLHHLVRLLVLLFIAPHILGNQVCFPYARKGEPVSGSTVRLQALTLNCTFLFQ